MDKLINDEDRIVIGVREWAVEVILKQELGIGANYMNLERVAEESAKLEKYILGGIKD